MGSSLSTPRSRAPRTRENAVYEIITGPCTFAFHRDIFMAPHLVHIRFRRVDTLHRYRGKHETPRWTFNMYPIEQWPWNVDTHTCRFADFPDSRIKYYQIMPDFSVTRTLSIKSMAHVKKRVHGTRKNRDNYLEFAMARTTDPPSFDTPVPTYSCKTRFGAHRRRYVQQIEQHESPSHDEKKFTLLRKARK